jgi:hypothetical protein
MMSLSLSSVQLRDTIQIFFGFSIHTTIGSTVYNGALKKFQDEQWRMLNVVKNLAIGESQLWYAIGMAVFLLSIQVLKSLSIPDSQAMYASP